MSHLIVSVDALRPPGRHEPLTVTTLRQQIRAGASPAVLYRIAGSAADYRRLCHDYGLARAPAAPPVVTVPAAPSPTRETRAVDRRVQLMGLIVGTIEACLVFPSSAEIAATLGVKEYLVHAELRALVREKVIRIGIYSVDGEKIRRVLLVRTGQGTALPAKLIRHQSEYSRMATPADGAAL